jgi:transposase
LYPESQPSSQEVTLDTQDAIVPVIIEGHLDYGDVAALHHQAHEVDLVRIIDRHVSKAQGIGVGALSCLMAINRCVDPKSKRQTPDWYAGTALPQLLDVPAERVNYQVLTRALDYLDEDTQRAIEHELSYQLMVRYGVSLEWLLYDVTTTYFEGTQCPMAHQGRSKDHRPDCKQISFDLVVNHQPRFPILHHTRPGNLAEARALEGTLKRLNEAYRRQGTLLVMDRNLSSHANLERVLNCGYDYVAGLSLSGRIKQLVLGIPHERFGPLHDDAGQVVEGIQAISILRRHRGHSQRLMVYYNPAKAQTNGQVREARLAKAEAELTKVQKNLNRYSLKTKERVLQRVHDVIPRVVRRFLKIKIEERTTEDDKMMLHMTVQRDQCKLAEAERLDGKFVLATSRLSLDAWETLRTYRAKDGVEKSFQVFKGPIGIRPIWHRKDNRVRAHVFICFLAYLLWCLLDEKLIRKLAKRYSVQRALEILHRVRLILLRVQGSDQIFRQLNRLTPEQRELLLAAELHPP